MNLVGIKEAALWYVLVKNETRITLVRVANLRKVQNAGKTLKPAKKALKSLRKATVDENAKGNSQTTNAVKSLGNYRSAGSKMPCLPTL